MQKKEADGVSGQKKAYRMSKEEKKYLEQYDITRFDRPSIAADVAVFSIMGKQCVSNPVRDAENFRKLPERKLKILLVKRAGYPYRDQWALPGGFCRSNEDVHEAARRELYEETHVKDAYINLCGIYGDVGRDPRGWIISHTFLALLDGEKCDLRAGSDAWEARWFDVELEKKEIARSVKESYALVENEYVLRLVNTDEGATNLGSSGLGRGGPDRAGLGRGDLDRAALVGDGSDWEAVSLSAVIRERRECVDYHEATRYEIVEHQGFAFDHAKIMTCALLSLRRLAETDGAVVFDLMPEAFTLTQLQKAFETILDQKLTAANFRRKIAPYVIETEQMIEGAGHRPAKLFRRNLEAFFRCGI